MKRILFGILAIGTVLCTQAQEGDYNRFSIELAGGVHKPVRAFSSGYNVNTPDFWQGSVGARYMFNNAFGIKADFGYMNLQQGDNSNEFESNYMRIGLQGVVNAGNILKFHEWTNTFGLLIHGGAGYAANKPKFPVEYDKADQMLNFIAGISPQVRLGNRVALTTDFSVMTHAFQDKTWDGTGNRNSRGFHDYAFTGSVGLTFYLGKNEVHADWYASERDFYAGLAELDERLTKVETDMIDSDQDGVPDYLDREPNTPSGVAVDTKGRAIDRNNNGIPDELESALDARYASKDGVVESSSASGAIRDLINNGYVNVYFRFNSTTPETYSLQSVNYLIQYMKENPRANAELIGYADEIGNAAYNQTLSENRAKAVYDLLVQAGISADRLSYSGGGVDSSVNKDSANARQLVRRVTFRLK